MSGQWEIYYINRARNLITLYTQLAEYIVFFSTQIVTKQGKLKNKYLSVTINYTESTLSALATFFYIALKSTETKQCGEVEAHF